jgi:hypothetical protein
MKLNSILIVFAFILLIITSVGFNVYLFMRMKAAEKAAEDSQLQYVAAVAKVDSSLSVAHAQLDSLLLNSKDSVIIHHRRVIERTIREVGAVKPYSRPDSVVNSINTLVK